MKALSLWQPWATAMAIGIKQNETRGRLTHYRGDLVICSALRKADIYSTDAMLEVWKCRDKVPGYHSNLGDLVINLPYGKALCMVEVYDCVPTERFQTTPDRIEITRPEFLLGNYDFGRFAWRTRNLRALKDPVPVKGRQGFWNLPEDVVANIAAQL